MADIRPEPWPASSQSALGQAIMKIKNYVGGLLLICAFVQPAVAEIMQFEFGGTGGNCRERQCWIQATGEIVAGTPSDFEHFITQDKYIPRTIRLHSPGGLLIAGIQLGQKIRAHGFNTEVGSDLWDPKGEPKDWRVSARRPGVCASACAYAFLGGVERTLEENARLGVHRFYSQQSVDQPTARQFTGDDLDGTQRLMAGLMLYVMQMGVDPRLVALAAVAGSDDMRWLTLAEARELKASYVPETWKPWRVEAYRGGAIAISETFDGQIRMVASCTKRQGPQVVLTDLTQPDDSWFKQNRTCATKGLHPVFGTYVDSTQVSTFRLKEGGAAIRFRLPTSNPPLNSPALFDPKYNFTNPMIYPMACLTDRYLGTTDNFEPAVRLALQNCFQG
jgi:hypothetical protein